ncbi:hypothetical protein CRUP_027241 [Coryphaenoides rupestris]|nr:hypothetical protein CRUP_027241 [Coryphaenoides rupestris]
MAGNGQYPPPDFRCPAPQSFMVSTPQHPKFKKEPDYAYFCDTCDRGFKTEDSHGEHMAQHVECSFPDCNFTAHEKIVNIHWRNSHAPGAKRIKLDTPDEITKWREERRRNYPTLENIEKKLKVQDVRGGAGGGAVVVVVAVAVANNGFQRGGPQYHGDGSQERPPAGRPAAAAAAARDGDPLGALVKDEADSDDKEDPCDGSKPGGGLVVAPKQMSSALGSLMADYGSLTGTDSEDEPQAVPIQKASSQAPPPTHPRGPQDAEEAATLGSQRCPSSQGPHRGRGGGEGGGGRGRGRGRGGRGGRGGGHMTPQKRATLLEMLLAPDIRHERNCVRYVVRSAFFGLERSDGDRQTTPTTAAVTKAESGVSGCRGTADGTAAPRSACVASEGVRQTGIAAAATATQEVCSAEEAQVVERPGTSEMEVDSVGDKSGAEETAESERPLICPSDSDEKQTGERVECVPMAEETQSDKVSDIATTTTDEATPTGVDKVSDVSTTTADESGVDKVSDVATTTADEATPTGVDKVFRCRRNDHK